MQQGRTELPAAGDSSAGEGFAAVVVAGGGISFCSALELGVGLAVTCVLGTASIFGWAVSAPLGGSTMLTSCVPLD